MKGKRVLITGGTKGVGRATAKLLVNEGCRVFICGRDPVHLRESIKDSPEGRIGGVSVDVGSGGGIEALFSAADDWLGGLDFAVLNAGKGAHGPLAEMTHEEYREVVGVSLLSYIGCAMESMRRMAAAGGHIIMTGSMSAHVFDENAAVYTATKAGVRGGATSLRKEANPLGIRVSLLEPGTIGSEMVDETPEQKDEMVRDLRMLRTEDVARAIHYVLCQPPVCDVISMQIKPQRQII